MASWNTLPFELKSQVLHYYLHNYVYNARQPLPKPLQGEKGPGLKEIVRELKDRLLIFDDMAAELLNMVSALQVAAEDE